MRSKIGTKSRLVAHIVALALFVFILVGAAPLDALQDTHTPSPRPVVQDVVAPVPAPVSVPATPAVPTVVNSAPPLSFPPADRSATVDEGSAPVTATQVAPDRLRPPGGVEVQPASPRPVPGIAASGKQPSETLGEVAARDPVYEPLRPATDAVAAPDVEPGDFPADAVQPVSGDEGAEYPVAAPDEAGPASSLSEPSAGIAEDTPASSQPDESGEMVVAAPEPGERSPDLAPLPNANIEVLDDNVYWLASRFDLDKELAALDRIGTLILLAPLPGHRVHGFEHVRTEVIPADISDLGREAADRFLHLAADKSGRVVIAVQSGARGAAFFKGAYFLANRNMSMEDVIAEIGPELEEAGGARDEIIHRLMRLRD